MKAVTIGPATLYLGDCEQILPTIDRPAAIVSDPPYGQGVKTNVTYAAGNSRARPVRQRSGNLAMIEATEWPDGIRGDDKPFDPEWLLERADKVLLWGAHRFGHRLPRGRTLVWDKRPNGAVVSQGDGETAWTNVDVDRPLRIYRLLWMGMCVGPAARHEVGRGQKRLHPTQKPEALMAWCLEQIGAEPGDVVCDPYMGAGATGVAAIQAGCGFVGIELEQLYFDTACRRMELAWAEKQYADRQSRLAL